ncbi:MAG: hypothetical protein ACRC20_12660 [Segniliparus sp.]|uniref:hypothetical protein n=1 Tax=Segniliparus sp. TaxID=2804064 RepID=UPI003F38AADD
MADGDKLRVDPDAALAVIDRARGVAADVRARGQRLGAGMAGHGCGADPAGAEAARLFASLNEAAAQRSEVVSSRLQDQASAAGQSVHATVGQDEAGAADIEKARPEPA